MTENRKSRGYWQELTNVVAEARKAKRALGTDILPSYRHLVRYGYDKLADGINRHHDFATVRRELREPELERRDYPDGYAKPKVNLEEHQKLQSKTKKTKRKPMDYWDREAIERERRPQLYKDIHWLLFPLLDSYVRLERIV